MSHQLRLLRDLGLATGTRQGRSIVDSLYGSHITMPLDEAGCHIEHRRRGLREDQHVARPGPDGLIISGGPATSGARVRASSGADGAVRRGAFSRPAAPTLARVAVKQYARTVNDV